MGETAGLAPLDGSFYSRSYLFAARARNKRECPALPESQAFFPLMVRQLILSDSGRRDRVALPSFLVSYGAWPGCTLRGKRGDSRRGIPFPRSDGDTCRDRPHPCGSEFRSLCAPPQCRRGNPAAVHRDTPKECRPNGPDPGTAPLLAQVRIGFGGYSAGRCTQRYGQSGNC